MSNYQQDIITAHIYCAAAMVVTPRVFALLPVAACVLYMVRAWRS